jgi:hypothetical protein
VALAVLWGDVPAGLGRAVLARGRRASAGISALACHMSCSFQGRVWPHARPPFGRAHRCQHTYRTLSDSWLAANCGVVPLPFCGVHGQPEMGYRLSGGDGKRGADPGPREGTSSHRGPTGRGVRSTPARAASAASLKLALWRRSPSRSSSRLVVGGSRGGHASGQPGASSGLPLPSAGE